MQDHRNDIFVTMGTLGGICFSYIGLNFADGLIGIVTSICILFSGIEIFKTSYEVLMDTDMLEDEKNKIINIAEKYEDIMHVDTIITKPVGIKYLVILKISMDGNYTLFKSHDIGGKLKQDIMANIENIKDVIIHINPH